MAFGYVGKILRVDLSNKKISIERPNERFYRTYVGGKGTIAYYLLREVPRDADPLSRENKLIFATGIMTGIPVAGMPRFVVGAKSPLTDGFGQSEAGGFWGPELKKAGYDAIIIEGKSEKPVYINIKDDLVEIKDASRLWGKETGKVQEEIIKELKDKLVRVAQIGPAGEKLVKYACITNNLKHYNGRNGLGAVMGSKNLRAIAVRGTKKLEFADSEKIKQLGKEYLKMFMEHPLSRGLYDFGTPGGVVGLNAAGLLPTLNFQKGECENVEDISGQKLAETILKNREGCYACAVKCKRIVDVDEEDLRIDPKFGGPEYETIAGFGSLCYTKDLKVVSKANELCNRYGMDTISTSASIAFAMECYEKRVLTKEDTDGLEIKFGDANIVYRLIEMIANRKGIGDLLAEGTYRAAKKIGNGSDKFIMTAKKQEFAMHDPRGKTGLAYSYSIAENGTDHMYTVHDTMIAKEGEILNEVSALGLLEPVSTEDISWKKVRNVKHLSEWTSFQNMAGLCILVVSPRGSMSLNTIVELYKAATGWNTSLLEIIKAGERTINMSRVFNQLHGLDSKDDKLSKRSFTIMDNETAPKYEIDKQTFKDGLQLLYEMRGWNENGVPTKGKLYELNLDWLVDELNQLK